MIRYLALMVVVVSSFASASDSDFLTGIGQYEEGNYSQSIESWNSLLEDHPSSGAIHHNLGNAFYRLGKLGESIFHFRRAQQLLPRDPDVAFNLTYLRGRTTDKIAATPSFWEAFLSQAAPWSQREAMWIFGIGWALFWLGLLIRFLKPTLVANVCVAVMGMFVVYGLLGLIGASSRSVPFGTLVVQEAEVRSTIGKDGILLFSLHEGAEFTIQDDSREWIRIALPDGKGGWLPKGSAKLN